MIIADHDIDSKKWFFVSLVFLRNDLFTLSIHWRNQGGASLRWLKATTIRRYVYF